MNNEQEQTPKYCRHCLYCLGDYCLKIHRHTPSKICDHFDIALICENCTKYPTCTSELRDYGSILDISHCINLPDEATF